MRDRFCSLPGGVLHRCMQPGGKWRRSATPEVFTQSWVGAVGCLERATRSRPAGCTYLRTHLAVRFSTPEIKNKTRSLRSKVFLECCRGVIVKLPAPLLVVHS